MENCYNSTCFETWRYPRLDRFNTEGQVTGHAVDWLNDSPVIYRWTGRQLYVIRPSDNEAVPWTNRPFLQGAQWFLARTNYGTAQWEYVVVPPPAP